MSRNKDENGFLHVSDSHLTKAGVFGYRGSSIPDTDDFKPEPDKIYQGYRSEDELKKAVDTFNGVPVLLGHEIDSADFPQKAMRVGSVGTGCKWNAPYIDGELTITDREAIDAIETEQARELSAGYRFTPVWSAGDFNGEKYDFLITNIRANHVALVPRGRAGRDVVVTDSAEKEQSAMNEEEFAKFIKEITEKIDAIAAKLEALNAEKPAIDEDGAEVEAVEEKQPVKPDEEEKPAEPVDAEKIAQDAEDRAVTRMKGMMKAAAAVAPIYGRVDILAFDSAESIYEAALKANGINLAGVDKSAYAAMADMAVKFNAAAGAKKAQRVAMDSAEDKDMADILACLERIK